MRFDLKKYQKSWRSINQEREILAIDLPKPISLSVFDSLPSSNTQLWQLLDSGAEFPLGAIALQQTAGKGQWGHTWVSNAGGLYLSVGLNLDLAMDHYPHLVMATVWGIATMLRQQQLPITIKWFNDLILEHRKLGGIKIETRNQNDRLSKAVVGVGINWRNNVPQTGINLQSYYQSANITGINSLEELTAIAASGILLGYRYYLAVGIDKLLSKYLEILGSLGKQVDLNGCLGEAVGVTTAGKLRVKLRSPGATTEIALSPGQISLGYIAVQD
ncbi:MAG: biotin--[acetyl-CoA-carboxylase] ligase [Cyanobacteria bacterium P01_C01_bin.72]